MKRLALAALLLTGGRVAAQDNTTTADAPVPGPVSDMAAQRFAAMDTNSDGRVDVAEWDRAVATRVAAAPADGAMKPAPNAPLPLPGAQRAELMRAMFARIDANGDGTLTLDEVRAFGRALGADQQR